MTVIAWDGITLAADKLNWFCGHNTTITKIRRIRDSLYGIAGKTVLTQACWHWIESGMRDEHYPELQDDAKEACTIMRIDKDRKIWICEHGKDWWQNEQQYYAIGGGAELAIGAMAMKASANDAVRIAINHNSLCGKGIDELTF